MDWARTATGETRATATQPITAITRDARRANVRQAPDRSKTKASTNATANSAELTSSGVMNTDFTRRIGTGKSHSARLAATTTAIARNHQRAPERWGLSRRCVTVEDYTANCGPVLERNDIMLLIGHSAQCGFAYLSGVGTLLVVINSECLSHVEMMDTAAKGAACR